MNYRRWQLANRITNIVAAKTQPTSLQGTCHGTHGGGDSASAAPKLAFGLKLGYRKNVKSVSLREVDSGER
jgi:cytochrome c553